MSATTQRSRRKSAAEPVETPSPQPKPPVPQQQQSAHTRVSATSAQNERSAAFPSSAPPTPTTTNSYSVALLHYEKGDRDLARSLAERELPLAAHPSDFVNLLILIACCSAADGNFSEAERLLATCSGYVADHFGESTIENATVLLNRGIVLLERYRLGDRVQHSVSSSSQRQVRDASMELEQVRHARSLLRHAEEVLVNTIGVQRLVLADVFHNLGVCCELLGGYTAALSHYMHSMQIREKFKDQSGVTELKLALTVEHVAMIYRLSISRLAEAGQLMASVAETRRRHLGPLHPLYASSVLQQAVIAKECSDHKYAASLMRQCLRIRLRVFGENHPQTRLVMALMGGDQSRSVRRVVSEFDTARRQRVNY